MALEFRFINDKTIGEESITHGPEGLTGIRYGTTNSRDAVSGLIGAAGMPRRGDPWSPQFPLLRVSHVGPSKPWGGTDAPSTGENGRTLWEIHYSERPAVVLPYNPGDRFTRISAGDECLTRMFDLRAGFPPFPPVPPIGRKLDNGNGAPIAAGTIQLAVHVLHDTSSPPAFTRIIRLQRYKPVNDGALTFPAIEGTQIVLGAGPGEAQYWGFNMEVESGGLLRVVHTINLAPDFLFYWQPENPDGSAAGEAVGSRVYPFTGDPVSGPGTPTAPSMLGLW